jgi:uncharacterized repeat protein (TIGR03803 family)
MKKSGLLRNLCIIFVVLAATAIASSAQTFATLHSFERTDGGYPEGGLVQCTDGNFYGTTSSGGAFGSPYGYGTVFKISTGGTLNTLHSFDSTDGATPYAGLVQGTDGNFYGTTEYGGAYGYGTVFQITPSGTLTTLHTFGYYDGGNPMGLLVQGTDGNFYGTASTGGSFGNYGTVFQITPTGSYTVLCSFNSTNGADPQSGLVQGTDGNFYGTTFLGGADSECYDGGGCGTVFKITSTGTLTTLHSFTGYPNEGSDPLAGLVQGSDGNFYGTTYEGGTNKSGAGTVFKITPSGTLTTLYSFCPASPCTDGSNTYAGLIQATDGNFYGVTTGGGANSDGTIFEITPTGTLTTLHSFDLTDGEAPNAAPVQGTDGNFYGTTDQGGAYTYWGTVFRLSTGLGPFVETNPTSGVVGTTVMILGDNLTGATSVSFNGTAATITVVSSTEIQTTVPAGATTGTVTVVTPSGTLHSNKNFVVTMLSTSTALTSSANPSAYLQPVTFTATVTPQGSGTPTGTVTFYDGTYGTTLCVVTLPSSGQAVCTTSTLNQGSQIITATYSGDSKFLGSTSSQLTQVVKLSTDIVLITSPNPSVVGQQVTLGVSVWNPQSLGIPTGTVTFYDGSTSLATVPLNSSGNAGYQTSSLSAGSHSLTASYSGDNNYLPSTSAVVIQQVNAPAVTLSPTSLSFGNQAINMTSAVKKVTLTNTGGVGATLTISSITASTYFAISADTCPGSLAAGAKCTVSVTFTPTVLGPLTGSLTFSDNAANSPQTVTLSGKGVAQATLTPASLTFAKQKVGTTSAAKNVTLKNNLPTALTGISYSTAAPFAVSTSTCSTTLASKKSCTISVTFSPTATGKATATLDVSDSASNSPQASSLTGTGD